MSVKLADTLAPMSEFPVAEAKDVDINIDGTHKDLQTAYEDGDLGGGSDDIQVELMPSASAEYATKVLQFVGASGTYTNGYFYKCVEDSGSYSWVQTNTQPSHATADDVEYDNTVSGLSATDTQEAIDEIVGGLGTASGKDFTDEVRPNSHDLVESVAVYSAINNALSTIYVPRGDLACSQLTSALLISENVGNVYQMSDSGYTSSLFINGAGILISAGDNVGIIKAGADDILFNYMGNAFDLHDYQKKDLTTAVEGQTTVEGALGLLEYKSGTFTGTLAEWDALPASEKAKYDFIATPDVEETSVVEIPFTPQTHTNFTLIEMKAIRLGAHRIQIAGIITINNQCETLRFASGLPAPKVCTLTVNSTQMIIPCYRGSSSGANERVLVDKNGNMTVYTNSAGGNLYFAGEYTTLN